MKYTTFLLPAVLAGFLVTVSSHGASVTPNLYTNGVGTSSGTPLALGDLVRVGTFTLSDALIAANQYNFATLNTNFVEFGTFSIGAGYGVAGHAVATLNGDTSLLPGSGGTIEGDNIYLWVFNASTAGAATQHGIFTSTNINWRFPLESVIPNTTTLSLSDVLPSGIVVGAFGTGNSTTPPNAALFNLVPTVPEPATGLTLLLVTAAGCLRRRRR
jgi:hypothetical protein